MEEATTKEHIGDRVAVGPAPQSSPLPRYVLRRIEVKAEVLASSPALYLRLRCARRVAARLRVGLVGGSDVGYGAGCSCGVRRHYPDYEQPPRRDPHVRAQTQIVRPLALPAFGRRRSTSLPTTTTERTASTGVKLRVEQQHGIRVVDITSYRTTIIVPSPLKQYSYDSANATKNTNSRWTIHLSRAETRKLINSDEPVRALRRMYNPAPAVLEDVASVDVPGIFREDQTDERTCAECCDLDRIDGVAGAAIHIGIVLAIPYVVGIRLRSMAERNTIVHTRSRRPITIPSGGAARI